MNYPLCLIRKTCGAGTRQWYWTGVCPHTGLLTWSHDASKAIVMPEARATLWMRAVRPLNLSGGDRVVVVPVEETARA